MNTEKKGKEIKKLREKTCTLMDNKKRRKNCRFCVSLGRERAVVESRGREPQTQRAEETRKQHLAAASLLLVVDGADGDTSGRIWH